MVNPLRLALAFACVSNVAVAEPLPSLNLEPEATTVSGLSSGAFMAVQLQVAFSSAISGAGIVAGGPYDCADQSLWRALFVCMDPFFFDADPGSSFESMKALAAENRIDPLQGIASDRLYLFHGQADDTVARSTMDALRQTYELLGVTAENMIYVTDVKAGHGFVTEQGSVICDATRPDFLIDCDFNQAGDILKQLEPPPVKWSSAMFWKTEETHGKHPRLPKLQGYSFPGKLEATRLGDDADCRRGMSHLTRARRQCS